MSDNSRDIFVISDLHMGDGGPRDNLATEGKESQIDRFLDHVAAEDGELIILGDLFDFWQAHVGNVLALRKNYLDRFAEMGATYVTGNHDADLEALIGTDFLKHPFFERMVGPFERTIGGRKFKFIHGHEVEPFSSYDTPGWGRIFAILVGIMEDKKGSPLLSAGGLGERSMLGLSRVFMGLWNLFVNSFEKTKKRKKTHPHHVEDELTPAQRPEHTKKIVSLFRKHLEENGYDAIIAGHTHRVGSLGDWYFNSGCWVGMRENFLKISPEGEVVVYDWTDDGPVARKGNNQESVVQ
ncbi:UDP-2,3-diacylglucosamine hydrolase [Anaerohalosphaera lusitana]|uniref:UDP-2,3-diacylglucosamine hydrolase n=1 Tax=Anaerohalosphaera lusitana TaxID=1936003 RepID=A0A1U9NQM7_9BACT|nr:UDP-2,3-diacylglucosamine diphosphatase [Anaerohalosphaera lusitana]AQT70125.1 UDP-2,3-diacylglucosamine hydrolase [Anaerohalosphaera lusitana]